MNSDLCIKTSKRSRTANQKLLYLTHSNGALPRATVIHSIVDTQHIAHEVNYKSSDFLSPTISSLRLYFVCRMCIILNFNVIRKVAPNTSLNHSHLYVAQTNNRILGSSKIAFGQRLNGHNRILTIQFAIMHSPYNNCRQIPFHP